MATNQTGIAIVIKAFLPTGKTLDEQFNALSIVKAAHETSDYAALLAAANVEEVKTESKTRRVEDATPAAADPAEVEKVEAKGELVDDLPAKDPAPADDADVPAFLKGKGKKPALADA